ncbi:MAG: CCA tRNA nucleotidyltransferase, partial [Thermoplasmatota archaeon]
MTPLEREVLATIEPDAAEEGAMKADAEALQAAADRRLAALRVPGQATVQGSVAKGTWLRGAGDVDLFLLLDPAVPEARLESIAEEVGKGVLSGVHKRYAQHPYLMGTFRGRTVDLVPAYRVAAPGARMSAVDRTPFHTEWVRSRLDGAARGEARILKQWLKGVGAYGAQTAVGGVSGYLAEVLVAWAGSFAAVVSWLAADAKPRRIALGPDQVADEVSPLVVVDPVDPARNCAAAVQDETLSRAVVASRAYLASPDRRFFFPAPPRAEPKAGLQAALAARREAWLGILLRPRTDRLDIVFPQFQKGARAFSAALGQAGFPVRRMS